MTLVYKCELDNGQIVDLYIKTIDGKDADDKARREVARRNMIVKVYDPRGKVIMERSNSCTKN